MDYSLALLEDYRKLFSGNMSAHGVHLRTGETDETGKTRGKNYTIVEPVIDELYVKHLVGEQGLGIIPIRSDGTVVFSVLDVDVYSTDHAQILQTIYGYSLPLIPFRSKSGGLHLYIFYDSAVKANESITILTQLKHLLCLDKKTEIFPKQKALKPDEVGNWINLPYFNSLETTQYLICRDGTSLDLGPALAYIKSNRISKKDIERILEALPLSDAPPCLQGIYLASTTSHRNNYLFSMAVYYKAKLGDDFENAVVEANSALDKPIEIDRLQRTAIASNRKKNYCYNCSEEPIVSICDKTECKKRKYGIGGSEVSDLSYEEFTQYKSDPPYYGWKIDSVELKFFKESDIINQAMFRELCFRHLHKLPMKLADNVWTRIVNTAIVNMQVQEVNKEDDISSGSLFTTYLTEFMTKRAPAVTKDQLLVDRVYYDKDYHIYIFKPKNFVIFLHVQKQFRVYQQTEIQDKLRSLGAVPCRVYISSIGHAERFWSLPDTAIESFVEPSVKNLETDFLEEMDEQPY